MNLENITSKANDVNRKYTLFDGEVWNRFVKPGEIIELRVLGAYGNHPAWAGNYARGTVSGYFDNHADFCKRLKSADRAKCDGVYITLQVIDARLIGRSMNRLQPAKTTTSDNNVKAFRWLPVDIDPKRPSEISSSKSELKAAMEMREIVAEWVCKKMDLPAPMKGMSGNGAHLLFPLPDLPVSADSTSFVRRTLEGLSDRFSNDAAEIDTAVYNPA